MSGEGLLEIIEKEKNDPNSMFNEMKAFLNSEEGKVHIQQNKELIEDGKEFIHELYAQNSD